MDIDVNGNRCRMIKVIWNSTSIRIWRNSSHRLSVIDELPINWFQKRHLVSSSLVNTAGQDDLSAGQTPYYNRWSTCRHTGKLSYSMAKNVLWCRIGVILSPRLDNISWGRLITSPACFVNSGVGRSSGQLTDYEYQRWATNAKSPDAPFYMGEHFTKYICLDSVQTPSSILVDESLYWHIRQLIDAVVWHSQQYRGRANAISFIEGLAEIEHSHYSMISIPRMWRYWRNDAS